MATDKRMKIREVQATEATAQALVSLDERVARIEAMLTQLANAMKPKDTQKRGQSEK